MHCLLLIQEYSEKDNSNIINKCTHGFGGSFHDQILKNRCKYYCREKLKQTENRWQINGSFKGSSSITDKFKLNSCHTSVSICNFVKHQLRFCHLQMNKWTVSDGTLCKLSFVDINLKFRFTYIILFHDIKRKQYGDNSFCALSWRFSLKSSDTLFFTGRLLRHKATIVVDLVTVG